MASSHPLAETVKNILTALRSPGQLDSHPWTQSLLVREALEADPALADQGQGHQLAAAIARQFRDLMPGSPPRQGKRLDTRWGEFGLLAAQYVAPYLFGAPAPANLRDAWSRIDQSILLFLPDLPETESARYRLVENEREIAPTSTLSDWQRKGIDRFAQLLDEREAHLSRVYGQPSDLTDLPDPDLTTDPASQPVRRPQRPGRWAWRAVLVLLLLGLIGLAAFKAWNVYGLAKLVLADARQLQGVVSGAPDLDKLQQAGPLLSRFRQDVSQLNAEAGPLLRVVGPRLDWVPDYGPDLAASASLLELAERTASAAEMTLQAATPILDQLKPGTGAAVNPSALTRLLVENQAQFVQARLELDRAQETRLGLDPSRLSPRLQSLFNQLDPLLALMDDGLTMVDALPRLLGASSEGPQTYLLLLENEDELRATGGYITSVGTLVVKDGEILSAQFQNSEEFQDWSNPYPSAPWQMQTYMNIPVVLLRDANWFSDYPTSAALAEFLYAMESDHSVDGVIALDQQALVFLLQAIGPVTVNDGATRVSASTIIPYMRQAKVPPPGADPAEWNRKAFIADVAEAILEKLLSGGGVDWQAVGKGLVAALDQRHILLQLDDPQAGQVIARHGWDGAIRPGEGDFLMVVDTNIGYSKTNAYSESSINYSVNLSDENRLAASLAVTVTNHSAPDAPCGPLADKKLQPGDDGYYEVENWYTISRCLVDYLRVYVPANTRLVDATPHAIPGEWMVNGLAVPPRVDLLDEPVDGGRGYGTLVVIPGGQTITTSFDFAVHGAVLAVDPATGDRTYTLKVQKQPGTRNIPITIQIELPAGVEIKHLSYQPAVDGSSLLFETSLTTDLVLSVTYSAP